LLLAATLDAATLDAATLDADALDALDALEADAPVDSEVALPLLPPNNPPNKF
jgi:hypothetical protein